jgi:O-antigen ligase
MNRYLAAGLTVALVVWLFWRDARDREATSGALWIPVMWIAITGSRFVSHWLTLGSGQWGVTTSADGSPVDALYFGLVIAAGIVVLVRRGLSLGVLSKYNVWFVLFLLYSLAAIAWSDFPFVAFKRYVKILGHPIVALIIATDPRPEEAFRTVLRRCAYLLLPFSILFIKYFPEYGRYFSLWTGEGYSAGVTMNKNELGCLAMIFIIFFVWNLLRVSTLASRRKRREEYGVTLLFLFMSGWLLLQARSSTALAGSVLGVGVLIILWNGPTIRRHVALAALIGVLLLAILEFAFDPYKAVVQSLGRDPTLTDRTKLWRDVLPLVANPLIGAGFESFWLGDRLESLWRKWHWQPNQAHNGYIETYLNLGVMGVTLLVGVLLATFRGIAVRLRSDRSFPSLCMALLLVILIYNYTEATFKGVHIVWTLLFIVSLRYPLRSSQLAAGPMFQPSACSGPESSMGVVAHGTRKYAPK